MSTPAGSAEIWPESLTPRQGDFVPAHERGIVSLIVDEIQQGNLDSAWKAAHELTGLDEPTVQSPTSPYYTAGTRKWDRWTIEEEKEEDRRISAYILGRTKDGSDGYSVWRGEDERGARTGERAMAAARHTLIHGLGVYVKVTERDRAGFAFIGRDGVGKTLYPGPDDQEADMHEFFRIRGYSEGGALPAWCGGNWSDGGEELWGAVKVELESGTFSRQLINSPVAVAHDRVTHSEHSRTGPSRRHTESWLSA